MRRGLGFLLSALLACLLSTPASALAIAAPDAARGAVPPAVVDAAQRGLEILREAASADPGKWRFASKEQVAAVELGSGVEVLGLGTEVLKAEADKDAAGEAAGDATDDASGTASESLLAWVDTTLRETWLFPVAVEGAPITYLQVQKGEDGTYEFVGFGGDASGYGIALDAFRAASDESAAPTAPVVLQYRRQYFLLRVLPDGSETVLPVPYDDASTKRVESGEGFVPAAQLIAAIRADAAAVVAYSAGAGVLDVWNIPSAGVASAQDRDRASEIVFLGCLAVLVVAVGIAGVYGRRAKRR